MLFALAALCGAKMITFESLLNEMGDREALSRWPEPEYELHLATSYNRESVRRDLPGWFADSDGTGYLREEGTGDTREYVMMEHNGPGCITKMWTPFFYYDFNERVGPNVRIYLDGSKTPVIDESLIKLVIGKGSIGAPWAAYSARAGNLYLPIPFAKSAKVTMRRKPFYFSVNYRTYSKGTAVETFRPSMVAEKADVLRRVAAEITSTPDSGQLSHSVELGPGHSAVIDLPKGANVVDQFGVRIDGVDADPSRLRSTVLVAEFDGEQTVWSPVGDLFCSADSVHPFTTFTRSMRTDGTMTCRWPMPYRASGRVVIKNLGESAEVVRYRFSVLKRAWNSRSMHFFARWRPDDVVPGMPFTDWNFVDVAGRGVYVGDAWTVLNIRRNSWWGEGDEKIYVDSDWDKGFPSHFGTGTEDYYGWAGGVYPVREDQFSAPFLSNVKIGDLDGHTMGFNINTRARGLDAIPFHSRLRFDMESSFGTDMREKWDLLGYSSVSFFYAFPGASHNRPAVAGALMKPMMSIADLERQSAEIRAHR